MVRTRGARPPALPPTASSGVVREWRARGTALRPVRARGRPLPALNRGPAVCIDTVVKADKNHRIFGMAFASVYPLYITKVTKKGRTKAEVDQVITWLTGYTGKQLQHAVETKVDFKTF